MATIQLESASVSIPSTTPAPGVSKDELTEPLYTDFTDDNPVAKIQQKRDVPGSWTTHDAENNTAVPIEKKHRVINFDQSRPFFCHVCKCESTDIEGFMRHSISVWHVKRTTELFSYKVKDPEKEEKKEPVCFPCKLCLITCNSENAWNAHLLGQKHRKILEKQGAERAMQKIRDKQPPPLMPYARGIGSARGGFGASRGGTHLAQVHGRKPYEKPVHSVRQPSRSGPIGAKDFAQYPEPLIGLEYVTEIQVTGQSPRYHCELCDAKFDHNLKFPHLVGAKHRFNVLKEKNPQATQDLRTGIKKRSELTGKLLEEAQKLENQEGRKQVKTRVEKSPFASVNKVKTQVETSPYTAVNKAGFNRNTRGRGSATGNFSRGRGASRGWGSHEGGLSSRGVGFTGQGQSYGQNSMQFPNPRGDGHGRGFQAGRGNSSWEQQFLDDPIVPHLSYNMNVAEYPGQSYLNQGERVPMLPAAAFQKRSPPRNPPINSYHDAAYQTYYSPPNDQFNHIQHAAHTFVQQNNPPQSMQMPVAVAFPAPAPVPVPTPTQNLSNTRLPYNHNNEQAQVPAATETQPASRSLLQEALGDLGKLVSSEEDASVALQVSNALTHALLTFRMKQMPEEEGVASTGARPTA